MKKYHNFENKNKYLCDCLSNFLKLNGIYYEKSGCGAGCFHFEILADENEVSLINKFLDSIF